MSRVDALLAQVQPLVEKLARELAVEMSKTFVELHRNALDAALAGFGVDAPSTPLVAKPTKMSRGVEGARQPRALSPVDSSPSLVKGKPRQRAVMRCRKCGAEGFRSDGCGRTHNTAAIAAEPASDDEEEPARVRSRRSLLVVEERVIPHAALVAMLVTDRAQDVGGDAGGYVARADRDASLVGHTEERREFCVVHGWVGRFAFDRDKHELCLPTGEPCSNCAGRKISGPDLCWHCDATGVEPIARVEAVVTPPSVPSQPEKEKRLRNRDELGYGSRSSTVAPKKMLRRDLRAESADLAPELAELDALRPKTRADCVNGPRPCPWVSCRHHLAIDINEENGSIKFNFPDLDPWELSDSCALDVADRGGVTLEQAGIALNVTRERLRQIEIDGLLKLRGAPQLRGNGDS